MSKAAGVHVSHTNRNGFGDYLRIPAEAGHPIPLLFGLNQNLWADIQDFSPTTKLIYRDDRYGADPFNDAFFLLTEAQAQAVGYNWVKKYEGVWALNKAQWYAFMNEPGVHTAQGYKLYAAFNIGAMQRANEIGVKLCLFEWSAGNPDLALVQHLIPALIMAKAGGHILGLHEYSFEGAMITTPPNTHILRYRQLWALLPVEAQCLIGLTEIGPGAGWGTGFTGQAYVNVIAAYDTEIMQDGYVIGGCLFDVGNAESNLSQDFPLLAAYAATTPTPDPGPIELPPAGCRGKPRVQYTRRVVLFPDKPAYGRDWYAVVGLFGYEVSRSADSAAIGDLDVREVIAVNPAEWPTDLSAWLAAHYPGVRVIPVNAATPSALRTYLQNPQTDPADPLLNVPYFNQLDGVNADYAPGDCGPACLTMILRYYAPQPITVDQVSQATGLPAGFLFTNWPLLDKAAKTFGYTVVSSIGNTFDVIKTEINAKRPVMALINYAMLPSRNKYDANYAHGHFSVIVGYNADGVTYHDPYWHNTDGKMRHLTWAEFDLCWATPNADFTYLRQLGEVKPYTPPPPAVKAWVGLHLRADPLDHNSPHLLRDLTVINAARLEAVKIKTSDTFESLDALIANGLNPARMVLRLFTSGDNPSLKSGQQFFNEQRAWLVKFASVGGQYVEIHNEPNLTLEGLNFAWSTPAQFEGWYQTVRALIKLQFPSLLAGFPGLSPQFAAGPLNGQYTQVDWLLACIQAIRDSDWVGVHAYWTSAALLSDARHGGNWKNYLGLNKPLLITEFANVGTDTPAQKGDQYVAYYAGLTAPVVAAYAYISSASDPAFAAQVWRTENGLLNAIAGKVGAR